MADERERTAVAGDPTAQDAAVSSRPDGRRARWDAHKAERRAQILDAAVALLEESAPDAEVHVSQIAERAGMVRTVVYRHFADRADLDRAVRGRIMARLREHLEPAVVIEGSIAEIIERIVITYVAWATAHPMLHRLGAQELPGPDGTSELQRAVQDIAAQVKVVFTGVTELLGVELSDDESAMLEPLVFGLVGGVFATVRHWLWRPDREPGAEALAGFLARTIWAQIDALARDKGVVIDPHAPLDELISDALA